MAEIILKLLRNNPQTIEFKEAMLNGRYNLKTSMSNKHICQTAEKILKLLRSTICQMLCY